MLPRAPGRSLGAYMGNKGSLASVRPARFGTLLYAATLPSLPHHPSPSGSDPAARTRAHPSCPALSGAPSRVSCSSFSASEK